MSPLTRFLCLFPFAVAVLAVVEPAHAQSVQLTSNPFNIINRSEERGTGERTNWINRLDCSEASRNRSATGDDDSVWVLIEPLVDPGGSSASRTLEVWISQTADCSDNEIRNGTSNNCTLVYSEGNANDRFPELYINPRDVVEQAGTQPGDFDPSGEAGDDDTCLIEQEQSITYWVMLFNGNDVIAFDSWTEAGVDTLAPPPPTSITGAPGDETVFVEWEIDSSDEQTDTYGFAIYCIPTGTEGIGGAGGWQGTDESLPDGAGGADSSPCNQDLLQEGELPPDEYWRCGETTGRGTRKGLATGYDRDSGFESLENGVSYAVAVAAQDTVYNDGRVSEVLCLSPAEVTTFFESYKDAGGQGGGGFCGLSGQPKESLWLLLLAAFGLHRLRRRQLRGVQ